MAGCLAAMMCAALPASLSARPATPQAAVQEQGGIKIRGHWVMEVRDPDGTFANRREFDNSFTPAGALALSELLRQDASMGRWLVTLSGVTGGSSSPCAGGTILSGTASSCYLIEPTTGAQWSGTAGFRNLTVQNVSNQVVLSGNLTALTSGQIGYVQTSIFTCGPTTPSSSCGGAVQGIGWGFTAHDLTTGPGAPGPLVVAAGQIVQVSVTISFCSSTGCQS